MTWTPSCRKVEWSTDTCVAGLNVKKDTLGNQAEHLPERFREHMRALSPIHDHHNITGHELSLDNFSIVAGRTRALSGPSEAILIRVNDPSLNRNIGKYQLLYIWDEVLAKSPELKLK